MHTENIEIVTTKERFFLEYLTLKKPIIDSMLTRLNRKKTTLSDAPLRVLAQLLYYYDLFKDEQDDEKRWAMVFSREIKIDILGKLKLKEHYLNNYLSHLRAIKILEDKKIRNLFVVSADDDLALSFTFKLNGHKE